MSIARLVSEGLLPEGSPSAGASTTPSTALAFAFDAGYLLPFKVMLASLARAGTLTDLPIHLYSTDSGLLDDPFVRAGADRFVPVEGDLLGELTRLADERLRRPERATWNRGTFLKWAVFQPAGVDQVLFLDADMIALGRIEPLLTREPEAHLVGCPQFPRSTARDGDGPADPAVLADRLERMVRGEGAAIERLNSGVMLLRRPVLDDAFRNELIAHAMRVVCVNEQSHLTSYFARHPGRLKLVPSAWNFHESYLKRLSQAAADAILAQVRILHYPGAQKPWLNLDSPARRRSLSLWRETAAWAGLL